VATNCLSPMRHYATSDDTLHTSTTVGSLVCTVHIPRHVKSSMPFNSVPTNGNSRVNINTLDSPKLGYLTWNLRGCNADRLIRYDIAITLWDGPCESIRYRPQVVIRFPMRSPVEIKIQRFIHPISKYSERTVR